MTMKKDEIIQVIKKQLEGYKSKLNIDEVGFVIQTGDGIAKIYGLEKAMVGEMLEFKEGIYGMIFNLEKESVGAVIFGNENDIKEGDRVKRTFKVFQVPVGEKLLGRVINPLGESIDGKGTIKAKSYRPIEAVAAGVIDRQPVKIPLLTGIKAIDAMVPVGRGQRELIIGDRQTGKTTIAVDTIINQKDQNVICIYVAIGQKQSMVVKTVEKLKKYGAMDYSIVVSSTSNDTASMQFIAPYAGCAVAEEFMLNGKDVLIVYDDLSKHAVAYRQISLLLRRPPGREAYPGDVFYLHSRLLERSVKLSNEKGGGSITALPIIETQAGDISAYIPTNVISITDGQIYLETGLFYSGIRPAVNVGLSVSRVGGSAQKKNMRKVAGQLRLDLAQYRELSTFAQFGAELDPASQKQLVRGEKLVEVLKQDEGNTYSIDKEVIIIHSATSGFLDDMPTEKIKAFEEFLFKKLYESNFMLAEKIKNLDLTEDIISEINFFITECKKEFRV